jgi:hypothetical protein
MITITFPPDAAERLLHIFLLIGAVWGGCSALLVGFIYWRSRK